MPIASKHIRQPVPTEQSVETGCFFVIKKEHKEMANTQERRERMLRLLGLRERWKVGELAREFGVTERTILRDVEQLSLTKPICTAGQTRRGLADGALRAPDADRRGDRSTAPRTGGPGSRRRRQRNARPGTPLPAGPANRPRDHPALRKKLKKFFSKP